MNHDNVKGKERLHALTMLCPVLQWQDEKNQMGWGKYVKLRVFEERWPILTNVYRSDGVI